jgi:penicillin-insensitive murein DD-endopeptidase
VSARLPRRAAVPLAVALLASACLPWSAVVAPPGTHASLGTASRGLILGAVELPGEGPHHRCYHRRAMRYGTAELVGLVGRAASKVAAGHPGAILYVGDLGAETGGDQPGHASHESGRDVDLAFFTADPSGRPLDGHPVTRFDRFGAGAAGGDRGDLLRFDAARNWALVEALLGDEEAQVQWIFASDGVKALLLRWAIDHDRDPEAIERAVTAIHQPGDSAPHDDHFHVRIYCPPSAGAGCVDVGPVWPWVEGRAEDAASTISDADLAKMVLEGL